MEPLGESISRDLEVSAQRFINTLLNENPEHKHLDILTEFLTRSSDADERRASLIFAAWNRICERDLWTIRYTCLSDYREAIGYTETIRPIVQRHKQSESAKRSSGETILRHWKIPYHTALPEDTRPSRWSKHLLSLMALLSKHRGHLESVKILKQSIQMRPDRGRNNCQLMASDVQRALKTIQAPKKSCGKRGSKLKIISTQSNL
jgi:hypothetical protein